MMNEELHQAQNSMPAEPTGDEAPEQAPEQEAPANEPDIVPEEGETEAPEAPEEDAE